MDNQDFQIRFIQPVDLEQTLALYTYFVEHTIISFEYEPPSPEEFLSRIESYSHEFPWLVCTYQEKVIGYAYAGKHRARTAYQWSPESTVYIHPDFQRKGIARLLYQAVFDILKVLGHFNVFAGVGLPNDKSVSFHKSMGFEEIGIFKKVGYKMGNWHDTQWFQLTLREHVSQPTKPLILSEMQTDSQIVALMVEANKRLQRI